MIGDIERQVTELFRDQLSIEIPTADTDLVEEGLLDSLVFVDLLMHLEQKFGVTVDLADVEIDDFRTVRSIAAFVVGGTEEGIEVDEAGTEESVNAGQAEHEITT